MPVVLDIDVDWYVEIAIVIGWNVTFSKNVVAEFFVVVKSSFSVVKLVSVVSSVKFVNGGVIRVARQKP